MNSMTSSPLQRMMTSRKPSLLHGSSMVLRFSEVTLWWPPAVHGRYSTVAPENRRNIVRVYRVAVRVEKQVW